MMRKSSLNLNQIKNSDILVNSNRVLSSLCYHLVTADKLFQIMVEGESQRSIWDV